MIGRGSSTKAAGVYAAISTIGAHHVSRTVRVQPRMFSAVTYSASGVQRHTAASAAAAIRIAAIFPQAGPRRLRFAAIIIGYRARAELRSHLLYPRLRSRRAADPRLSALSRARAVLRADRLGAVHRVPDPSAARVAYAQAARPRQRFGRPADGGNLFHGDRPADGARRRVRCAGRRPRAPG